MSYATPIMKLSSVVYRTIKLTPNDIHVNQTVSDQQFRSNPAMEAASCKQNCVGISGVTLSHISYLLSGYIMAFVI